MGNLCTSLTPEEREEREKQRKLNRAIEDQQQQSLQKDEELKKLLLLGAGESGKSTLFKQMITLYGKGYPEEERKTYKPIVFQNTITAMKILIRYCDELKNEVGTEIDGENIEVANRIRDLDMDTEITKEIAEDIKTLWTKDSGIRKTFENRTRFQFPDSGNYFFDRVDDICKEGYIPTEQDVLRSRVRTTGIVETAFDIDGNQFRMFDVGGQRNERKKWIHCFENVTCVIFVAAISEYDQVFIYFYFSSTPPSSDSRPQLTMLHSSLRSTPVSLLNRTNSAVSV